MVKTGSTLRKPRVLIADDMPDILELLARVICDAGDYRCVQAEDGQEALVKYEQALHEGDLFQLLILDAAMPHKTGFEVTKAVREVFGDTTVPIIIITAYVDPVNAAHLDYVGADVILPKPFDLEELKTILRVTLGPITTSARVATKVLMAAHAH